MGARWVQAPKDAKAHEKAEDPIFVLEHGIPIDSQHYLEHHLKLPLTRLFEPLMKNSNELLSGQQHLTDPFSRNAHSKLCIEAVACLRLLHILILAWLEVHGACMFYPSLSVCSLRSDCNPPTVWMMAEIRTRTTNAATSA